MANENFGTYGIDIYFNVQEDKVLDSWNPLSEDKRCPKMGASRKNIRVLQIEDNEGDWFLVSQMFAEINSSIALEHNLVLDRSARLSDALHKMQEQEFEVILLDLSLPDSSGVETLSELKVRYPETSIIVFSGLSDLDTAICAVYDGAQDYIVKGQVNANFLFRSILYAYERKKRETDRVLMEAQVNHTERLKSLGLLAGGVAHDFNNLLMVMLTNIDLLSNKVKSQDADVSACIKNAKQAAMLASGLTKQLLSYAGTVAASLERVDLSKTISNLKDFLKSTVHINGKLHFDLSNSLPEIEVDPAQFNQIIINLVINASDAMGGKPGSITIRTSVIDVTERMILYSKTKGKREPGYYVCMEVKDDGQGMSAEVKRKIFDPFYSTKGTGRGLGLSAVWGIVENANGIIDFESASGQGTTFKVMFEAVSTEGRMREEIKEDKGLLQEGVTVLVVDDNELVNHVTSSLLKVNSFEVLSAKSGKEAVEIFTHHNQRITLVLLDLTMPDMGGLEVFQKIREIRRDVPVVFASGYAVTEEIKAINAEGSSGFLQKPYSNEILIKTVRKLLNDKAN